MGFAISTDDLPSIKDYAAADKIYGRISPIRGSNTRPLGNRRHKHKQIVRGRDVNGVVYYAARLYNTDCVTYMQDGRILVSTGGYCTQSTAAFISAILPYSYSARCRNGRVLLLNANEHAEYIIGAADQTIIYPDGTVSSEPCVVLSLSRRGMKKLRDEFRPVITHIKNFLAAFTVVVSIPPYQQSNFRSTRAVRDAIISAAFLRGWSSGGTPASPFEHLRGELFDTSLAYDVLGAAISESYVHAYDPAYGGYVWRINKRRVLDVVERWLMAAYADRVFEKITLPLGVVRRGTYNEYTSVFELRTAATQGDEQ